MRVNLACSGVSGNYCLMSSFKSTRRRNCTLLGPESKKSPFLPSFLAGEAVGWDLTDPGRWETRSKEKQPALEHPREHGAAPAPPATPAPCRAMPKLLSTSEPPEEGQGLSSSNKQGQRLSSFQSRRTFFTGEYLLPLHLHKTLQVMARKNEIFSDHAHHFINVSENSISSCREQMH